MAVMNSKNNQDLTIVVDTIALWVILDHCRGVFGGLGQLQAIRNNLIAPRGNEIVASNGLAVPVFTMDLVLLFLMWAITAAIPCEDHGLQVQDKISWS